MKKITEKFLTSLANSLDISDTLYNNAVYSYESLGEWLNRANSSIKKYGASVYLQGSFALGTVVKPITDEDDYDIDLVCQVDNLSRSQITQEQLKELVGFEIKLYNQAHNFNKNVHKGRRCWTLNYSDDTNFHLDILPSINNIETSIFITDIESKKFNIITDDWPVSDPKAYQNWFRQRNTLFESKRRFLAESRQVSIDKVPEYTVKTPLQRAIQIAKRQRDIICQNWSRKPISIIITTLFAMAYNGENTISDIFESVVPNLFKQFEQTSDGHLKLKNPVNNNEYFTDRWIELDEKNFIRWLDELVKVAKSLTSNISSRHFIALYDSFGEKVTRKALVESLPEEPLSTTKITEPIRPWRKTR